MSIFDSSEQIVAASVTTKLLPDFDNPLPGIVASTTLTGADLVDSITTYYTQGLFSRAENYFRYGRDYYSRGLIRTGRVALGINHAEVQKVIEDEIGIKIQVTYSVAEAPIYKHYAAYYLQETREMDSVTLLVSNPPFISGQDPGTDVFLKEIKGINIFTGEFEIDYYFTSSGLPFAVFTEEVILPDRDSIVYQVEYQTVDDNLVLSGIPMYWRYYKGTGTYPVLDVIGTVDLTKAFEHYPIVPFYEDKLQIGNPDLSGTDLYKHSKKLIEKLGFNYKDIVNILHEGTEESIGSDKGLYAYLMLSACVTDGIHPEYETATTDELNEHWKNNQPIIHYLIEYFKQLNLYSGSTKSDYDTWKQGTKKTRPPMHLGEHFFDTVFSMYVSYNYIDIKIINGVIGNIGWCNSELLIDSESGSSSGILDGSYNVDTSVITYRRQETSTTYIQIDVRGLTQINNIFNNILTTTTVSDAFREDSPTLITMPVDRSIVKKMPIKYRNRVIHASLHLIFNSYVIQEIEWYQDSIWSFVITAVALILAAPTGGGSLTFAYLFTVAGLTAAAYALLIAYIKYLIFKEIVEFIGDKFGIEVAFILAIALMAYGKGVKSGSFPGLPWAQDLLAIGSSIWSATNAELQEQMKEVERDYARMRSETEVMEKELNRGKELLNVDADIDPWLFVNPLPELMFSHTADQFISMRLDNTNPGVQTLESPSMYVDLMLRLPTIDDTLTK